MRIYFVILFSGLLIVSLQAQPPAPAKQPLVEEGCGVGVDAELIYWVAKEEGLNYSNSYFSSSGNSSLPKGNIQQPGFRFNPGFRAGLNFDLPHDHWKLLAQYTWIRNGYNQSSTENFDTSYNLLQTWITNPSSPLSTVQQAQGKWKIQNNVVSLDLIRENQLSDYFTYTYQIALLGAWNTQNYLVKYSTLSNYVTTTNSLIFLQHFYGIGPKVGSKLEFFLNEQWHIYGSFFLSSLWSRFSINQKNILSSSSDNAKLFFFQKKIQTISPIFNWNMGLLWHVLAKEDLFSMLFQIGWEQQIWFNQNQFQNVAFSSNGNLNYQGLTLKLQFEF